MQEMESTIFIQAYKYPHIKNMPTESFWTVGIYTFILLFSATYVKFLNY